MAVKKFDEVVLFARTGLNPRTNFKLGSGKNKYITIKNIHNNELTIDENTDVVDDAAIELIHKRSQIKKGDILFCSIGRMGDMYIIPEEPIGWDINESVFALTLDTNIVRQKYFYYVFKNHNTIEYLTKNSSGSTFKSIKMNQLKKMVFNLPSLDDQDKIIDVLDRLSKIIKNREVELGKLDELIKARFVELFGGIREEQLLGEISEFVTVGIANSATHAYAESGVPMLRNQNIKENYLDDSDLIYIKPEFAAKYDSKKLKENDIIAMRTGYPGVACLVPKKYEGGQTFTTLIVRLKADNNPSYVCSYINSDLGKRFIESEKVGAAQQNVGAKSLAQMPIKIAPKELQIEYAEFVEQVDKSKFDERILCNILINNVEASL